MNYKWLFNQKQWREKWSDGFKVPKGKRICQPKILYTVKIILQKRMWNKDRQKPREFITNKPHYKKCQKFLRPEKNESISTRRNKKVSERTNIGQIKRYFYFSTFIIYIYVQFFKYQPPQQCMVGFITHRSKIYASIIKDGRGKNGIMLL